MPRRILVIKTTLTNLRKIIKNSLLEARGFDWDATIKRNKPYITDDPYLFYSLRQNGNPMSIEHYALNPVALPTSVIELIEGNEFLQDSKCVGKISTFMQGHSIYLFRNSQSYIVVAKEYGTGRLTVADGISPSDYSRLVEVTKYMASLKSGNPDLDKHISRK